MGPRNTSGISDLVHQALHLLTEQWARKKHLRVRRFERIPVQRFRLEKIRDAFSIHLLGDWSISLLIVYSKPDPGEFISRCPVSKNCHILVVEDESEKPTVVARYITQLLVDAWDAFKKDQRRSRAREPWKGFERARHNRYRSSRTTNCC